jgi:hypothetical protein
MENLFTQPKKIIALGALLFLVSCSSDDMTTSDLQSNSTALLSGKNNTEQLIVYKGPEIQLGYGKVRSWISVTKSGNPNEIGLEITAEALQSITNEDDKKIPADHSTIIVPLHLKARQLTPFNHIGLNWNPNGHMPNGVFDIPHFDFHFYMISVNDQMAIPEWSEATDAEFNNYPPEGYMPADYFTPPGGETAEPQMGKHWLPTNLENYLPFSQIMIYGSYNGNVIFVEPMITLDFLLSKVDSSTNYSQPEFFQKPGNYPTKYNVYHDAKTAKTYITLSDFIMRD